MFFAYSETKAAPTRLLGNDTTLKENDTAPFLTTTISPIFKIFEGFNFNIGGSYSITRNQINIPIGDVSLEDLLLEQQQLESGYNFSFNVGFNYSFGSIYNTIVNPRFNF